MTVPREFVFMDRAAIGLGGVFLHLRAELNFYRLFNEAIENFSIGQVAARQAAALQKAGLIAAPPLGPVFPVLRLSDLGFRRSRCPCGAIAVTGTETFHALGTAMADHSEVAYTTADGNDYKEHEQHLSDVPDADQMGHRHRRGRS